MVDRCNTYCDAERQHAVNGIDFFHAPSDQKMLFEWISAVSNKETVTGTGLRKYMDSLICSLHFETTDFVLVDGNRKLLPSAVPSQFLRPYEAPVEGAGPKKRYRESRTTYVMEAVVDTPKPEKPPPANEDTGGKRALRPRSSRVHYNTNRYMHFGRFLTHRRTSEMEGTEDDSMDGSSNHSLSEKCDEDRNNESTSKSGETSQDKNGEDNTGVESTSLGAGISPAAGDVGDGGKVQESENNETTDKSAEESQPEERNKDDTDSQSKETAEHKDHNAAAVDKTQNSVSEDGSEKITEDVDVDSKKDDDLGTEAGEVINQPSHNEDNDVVDKPVDSASQVAEVNTESMTTDAGDGDKDPENIGTTNRSEETSQHKNNSATDHTIEKSQNSVSQNGSDNQAAAMDVEVNDAGGNSITDRIASIDRVVDQLKAVNDSNSELYAVSDVQFVRSLLPLMSPLDLPKKTELKQLMVSFLKGKVN